MSEHKIIMPALGMSQDTGHIITWHKNIGDAVKSDDILLEVETDKSAMEVEASFDGYIAQILAPKASDVPVGEVIAVIAAEKPDDTHIMQAKQAFEALTSKNNTEKSALAGDESPVASHAISEAPVATPAPAAAKSLPLVAATSGKILASPKAKKWAGEQNITLEDMRKAQISEPFHYDDVRKFAQSLPANDDISIAYTPTPSILKANIDQSAFEEFVIWAQAQEPSISESSLILAAFISSAYRKSHGLDYDEAVVIAVEQISHNFTRNNYLNPDCIGLSDIQAQGDETPLPKPHILLRDLRHSFLEEARLAQDLGAVLSLAEDKEKREFQLTFSFSESFDARQAITFMHELTQTLAVPARHML